MNRGLIVTLALAATALAPAPTLAQQVDWNMAKAAFDAGVADTDHPDDRDKRIGCAAFWSAWNNAANAGRVPADAGTRVSSLLVAPDSNIMALGWLMASLEPGAGEDQEAVETAVMAQLQELEPFAALAVSNALAGDGPSLTDVMRLLGVCQTFPE
ncbi:MAG: hypothetical protein ACK4IC_11440 [Erythrobacter sp.]